MKAVTIVDGELRWQDHPDPEPGTGEVLVAVKAAGINGGDRLQLAGKYPAPSGSPPDIPGLELAGEVAAVGPGTQRFAIGDRVMAVVGGGGQAELCVVNERHLLPVPDGVDWAAAGGFAEAFTTAHDALFSQAGLAVGERLCVDGAAGGVGIAGVQLGVAAGCAVVATVRNDGLRDAVGGFGADAIAPDGFGERGPFDVILELIGAPNLAADLAALATWGRLAIIGVGAGARGEIDLRMLMGKRGRIVASTLRARSLEEKAVAARAVEKHVVPLLAAGTVTVPVDATFPLADAAAGYDHFAAGGKLGKVVLVA